MISYKSLLARKLFIPLLYHYWGIPAFQKYDELILHDKWPFEKIIETQEQKLIKILRYSVSHIPYYRDVLSKLCLNVEDIKAKDALQYFPILTKVIIQERFNDLLNSAFTRKDFGVVHSGGSTGQPTKVRVDLNTKAYINAATWRANSWMGWEIGDAWMWIWGRLNTTKATFKSKIVKLYNLVASQEAFFNVHGLDNRKLLKFVQTANWFRPKLITGYASALYQLCLMVRKEKIRLPQLLGVATTAEMLFPEQRKIIEEVLGCKVFNRYASSEVGLIASECSMHDGFHIAMENVYLEIVDNDGNPVPLGHPGRILVTDLNNKAMPLIRYDLGDVGVISPTYCRCGLPYMLLKKVIGRQFDVLRMPNGKIVFPDDLAEIFYPLDFIKKFQVVQETFSKVIVSIALKAPVENESTKALIYDQLLESLGEDVDLTIDYVDDIPILPSGKHRICISKVI